MAHGDECKTASKANYAVKQFEVSAPVKKPINNQSNIKETKQPAKNYGAWGSTFKDKKTFLDMHIC